MTAHNFVCTEDVAAGHRLRSVHMLLHMSCVLVLGIVYQTQFVGSNEMCHLSKYVI